MKALLFIAGLPLAALAQMFTGGPALDSVIEQAVKDQLIPGAVVVVGHDGEVVYRKAYGSRSLVPQREPMTLDTIFDAASLTKVIATTSCMMKLLESGQVRLTDKVTQYLPEFQGGKSDVTVRDLMVHFSGLRPDLDMPPKWTGYDTGVKLALADKPANPPGVKFVYSDINFILLGEIVHRVSGRSLADFAKNEIFRPLGMMESTFNPPAALLPRIAPTEVEEGKPVRGLVHDPTARAMDGVAGHAGLFTTADDLARFAQMMLNLGELGGSRFFSPLTIRKFTTPQTPADQPILRGLGWDIDSPFSSNRGELFPIGSYGHTGFTGTSVWIDPLTHTYAILLTNSVHPHRGKNLSSLRGRVATVAAAGIGLKNPAVLLSGYNQTRITSNGGRTVTAPAPAQVLNGADVLAARNFDTLRGKRVGLITNHTGLLRDGRRTVDAMVAAGIQVTALFSPEHGIAGAADDDKIQNGVDASTRIPVYSLYQADRRRLTADMLKDVDLLVYDIQDVGARFYTYSCTMLYGLEEAAKNHRPFVLLDRPNPITGLHVEGPVMDKDLESFVGCFELPVRHGMSFGELARMMNGERKLGADLNVIQMTGWQRGLWFDQTGETWVDPSPNMQSLNAALLYPGVALLESAKNYSVGRGTGAAFEQIGATWIRGVDLAGFLNARNIPGVHVYPTRFKPVTSNFAGTVVEGVRFVITDRDVLDSVRLGTEIAYAVQQLYPSKMDFEVNKRLIGSRSVVDAFKAGVEPRTVRAGFEKGLRDFEQRRKAYLLY